MTAYRILWWSICVPLAVLGAVVAFVASPAAAASLVLVFGIIGGLLTACSLTSFWERGARGRLRLLLRGMLVAGVGVAAFVGYAALLGPGVVVVAAVVLAGSPYVVTTSRSWLSRARTPSIAQFEAVARALAGADPGSASFQPPPELRALSDEQLCKRWRVSYRASRRGSSAVKLIAACAERRMYLDEIERRNESGFAAWLASWPEAAEDPLPYLVAAHHEPPAVDWDELTRGPG